MILNTLLLLYVICLFPWFWILCSYHKLSVCFHDFEYSAPIISYLFPWFWILCSYYKLSVCFHDFEYSAPIISYLFPWFWILCSYYKLSVCFHATGRKIPLLLKGDRVILNVRKYLIVRAMHTKARQALTGLHTPTTHTPTTHTPTTHTPTRTLPPPTHTLIIRLCFVTFCG